MASGSVSDAGEFLAGLVGRELQTLTGRPNRILRVDGPDVVVATGRSPNGTAVPIAWVQQAMDQLRATGQLEINVPTVGYRSAFIGAALRELPGVETRMQRLILDGGPVAIDARAQELARREGMWQALVDGEGTESATPQELRRLGVYGGAGGVWVDKARTAGIGDAPDGVAVSVLHTGRHYPDDLSDTALLYHYPATDRPAARDEAEINALKSCGRLRLPAFVITETNGGQRRRVQRGWIEDWDDESAQVLVSLEPDPPPIAPEEEPFRGRVDREPIRSSVARRPNQQRFKLDVLKRYGTQCAMCDVSVPQLIKAAHLIPFRDGGSDDPRNGLPLCANHHDALDSSLVRIDPDTLELSCDGVFDAHALGLARTSLQHLRAKPHAEALRALARRGRLSEEP